MVNTRRMESGGSTHDDSLRHRTRKTAVSHERLSSESNSELEDSQEESWSAQNKHFSKPAQTLPTKVRELRNRFVCGNRSFTKHHLKQREIKSNRISLDERHSVTIYSSRKMHDDSDAYGGNNSEEELFSPRARRSCHYRRTSSNLARIERRTALSLRPIGLKSYADPHSPINFNTDSDDKIDYVRRSTRKKKLKHANMSSWLDDDQMHKIGYPNLDAQEYSEEDSHDIQAHHNSTDKIINSLDGKKHITRHSLQLNGMGRRRKVKNPKYLMDYETTDAHPKRKTRSEESVNVKPKDERQLRSRLGSNDKENNDLKENINVTANGKLVKFQNELEKTGSDDSDKKKSNKKNEKDNCKDKKEVTKKNNEGGENVNSDENEGDDECNSDVNEAEKEKEQSSSDDDTIRKIQTRRSSNRIIKETFSPRKTRSHKISESSSSSEVGKGYSLRDRPTKPPVKQLRTRSVRELAKTITRRHFTRRRSTSSSSSDSDEICCKNDKYNTGTKNIHNKNDQRMKSGPSGSKILPINPETLDSKVRFTSIGGLDSHVQCLKEMILLPMMYPEVFHQFQIDPPRGVLFHGPPGTGKTLIARALANECSFGARKVSFFMRKGADLLSKWIGESEKQLRLLFEQAAEMKPSIIFFDELDGLAPVRSSRQDQIHASIVSTLLALMDGLEKRGEVIVIGATNRIDAIDPALRRPGRFDRELYFSLPSRKEREEILKVYVSQWKYPPNQYLLSYLAEQAVGYCGSDLRALCSEAVIQGFRRKYPQVYNSEHKLLLDPDAVKVEKIDFLRAKSHLVPASHRIHQVLGRNLLPVVETVLKDVLNDVLAVLQKTFPHGLNPKLSKVKLFSCFKPAQLLLLGDGSEHGQTTYLAPAVLYHMEHINAYMLDLTALYGETGRSSEEACVQIFNEARRNVPSIIYIPNIDNWWSLTSDTVKAIFLAQLKNLTPNTPILMLATASCVFSNLPVEIQHIFSTYRKEIIQIYPPNTESRKNFFKKLVVEKGVQPPRVPRKRSETPPLLPRAPTPPPTPLTEDQAKKLYEQEERTLRELRIFLRDMCKKLASNRLFYMFTKPVDTEEVPDYTTIIKQPMDLETMMTKVDYHRYECAKDFLSDIELICQNALEYNPAKTSADKQIRHRACSLRDYAYTLIKNEMDSDFEEKCQDISKKRRIRKASITQYLPAYIQTPADNMHLVSTVTNFTQNASLSNKTSNNAITQVDSLKNESSSNIPGLRISPSRKRKISSWQRGLLNNRKKRRKERKAEENSINEDKLSSADEVKESASTNDENVCNENENLVRLEINTPLSINCDATVNKLESANSVQSSFSKRRLSNLQSPSELLDEYLDFDDIDQALEKDCVENGEPVNINKEELENVLEEIVKITKEQSLQILLDLHCQFNKIIKQFSKMHNRESLPKELLKELERFKSEVLDEEIPS